jgi:hypothetical protein
VFSKYSEVVFCQCFTIMLVTCHCHYHLLKGIINILYRIYIYIYNPIDRPVKINFLSNSFFFSTWTKCWHVFNCAKKEMEGSTYLHVIQLEFHILLTINWWKKWIDFVKNKFHLDENIELHCMQLHWIKFHFNSVQTQLKTNHYKYFFFKLLGNLVKKIFHWFFCPLFTFTKMSFWTSCFNLNHFD